MNCARVAQWWTQVFRVRSVTDAPEPRTARIGIKNEPRYGTVTHPFAKMMSKILISCYHFIFFLFFGDLVLKKNKIDKVTNF